MQTKSIIPVALFMLASCTATLGGTGAPQRTSARIGATADQEALYGVAQWQVSRDEHGPFIAAWPRTGSQPLATLRWSVPVQTTGYVRLRYAIQYAGQERVVDVDSTEHVFEQTVSLDPQAVHWFDAFGSIATMTLPTTTGYDECSGSREAPPPPTARARSSTADRRRSGVAPRVRGQACMDARPAR